MTNSPRTHVRTRVNAVLKAVKQRSTLLQNTWTSRSTTFEVYMEKDGLRNARQVPRPAADYAENNPAALASTVRSMNDMIAGLTILRDQLIEIYQEVADQPDPAVVYPPAPPSKIGA